MSVSYGLHPVMRQRSRWIDKALRRPTVSAHRRHSIEGIRSQPRGAIPAVSGRCALQLGGGSRSADNAAIRPMAAFNAEPSQSLAI